MSSADELKRIMNQLPSDNVGYIYADGSYSDEREPRGATVVPRRQQVGDVWSHAAKCWLRDGKPIDPDTAGTFIEPERVDVQPVAEGEKNVDALIEGMSNDARMEMFAKLSTMAKPVTDGTDPKDPKDITPKSEKVIADNAAANTMPAQPAQTANTSGPGAPAVAGQGVGDGQAPKDVPNVKLNFKAPGA